MVSTALQVAAGAFLDAGTGQDLTAFDMTTEFPFCLALNCINSAISALNLMGSYSFAETTLILPYSVGVSSYNLNTVGPTVIEPRRIMRLRRELVGLAGELVEYNYRDFQKRFRAAALQTQQPRTWAKYAGILYLDSIPDKDYTHTLYYYQHIEPIVVGVNDNLPTIIPEHHIDILRDMTNANLLKEMGRPDFANQYTLAKVKASALLARSNQDSGMLTQMPRSF